MSWTPDGAIKYSGVAAEILLWILSYSVDKCDIYFSLPFPNISQDLLPMSMIMVKRYGFLCCTHMLHISWKQFLFFTLYGIRFLPHTLTPHAQIKSWHVPCSLNPFWISWTLQILRHRWKAPMSNFPYFKPLLSC